MAEERLTDEEVAKVLRRAAELDLAPVRHDGGLPVAAVEAAAAEVGLAPDAVRRAVAELRAGALDEDVSGPDLVVCARVVPGDVARALESVGRYLSGQAFARARDRATEQVWRPREDVVARLLRRMDFAAAIRLKSVDEVVVRGVEVEGGTLVRVVARLEGRTRRAPTIGSAVGGAVGAAGAFVVGMVEPVAGVVVAVPGVGGAGTLGWRLGRAVRARERHKVAEAVDGMLDELEQGRTPGTGRAFDRLARRARRVRHGYRI